jgi:hypothetical protein
MPVVMNMAHEAKPHLPGAVLMLLAVLAASRYVETGGRCWWITAGALCGAAFGMVLSSLPIFGILPVMVFLRWFAGPNRGTGASPVIFLPGTKNTGGAPVPRGDTNASFIMVMVASALLGAGVYLVTNPYVPINLARNRAVLQSNFGNSTAMYHAQVTAAGIANAAKLIAVGTAPLLAIAGVIGAIALAIRAIRVRHDWSEAELRRRATGLLLAVPALWVTGQCILLATGKPGEFGRFAIFPDVVLLIEAVVAIATFIKYRPTRGVLSAALLITTAAPGALYLRAFLRDSRPETSRLQRAATLQQMQSRGATRLAVFAEPAPYCQPPVDLWRWKVLLMPRDALFSQGEKVADVSIRTVDVPPGAGWWGWIVWTPISWASKPFEIDTKGDSPGESVDPLPVRR